MECHGKLENFHQVRMEWNWRKLSSQLYHVLSIFSTPNSEAVMELEQDKNTATKHFFPHLPDEDFNKGATPSPHPPTPLSCGSLIFFISFASSGYCGQRLDPNSIS